MTPADREVLAALGDLLDDALDVAPADQEAWLAALAPEHAALAPRLRGILARRGSAAQAQFLAAGPKMATGETSEADERDGDGDEEAGQVIGPYRLVRRIGRGGMGTVWLADRADGMLERQVAIKLPRVAFHGGFAARMRRERDIVAMLKHPGIARLYDAGVDTLGRPFLALEFIDGQPIDLWCEARGLGVRDRLRLFLQVVEAVAHAHAALVVHRDLKPSNVLVTPEGQACLLDFGIAKLLQPEAGDGPPTLTRERGAPMTLRYAAPEQIQQAPVTVASDIWSLGVLLYELLAQAHPFDPQRPGGSGLEQAILAHDPLPASAAATDRKRARELRGDIDAMLAKALQREPRDRYATAHSFAQDIERHLAGLPVEAQRASGWYRLRKAIGRHRFGVAASSAILAVALIGATLWAVQERIAARQAQRARLATEFVSELLRSRGQPMLLAASPAGTSDQAFVDSGAQLIQARFAGEPDLQEQLYGTVARVYADLGADALAIDYAHRQIALLDRMPVDHAERVRALLLLAESGAREERVAEAEAWAREAVELADFDPGVRLEAMALLADLQFENGKIDLARAAVSAADRYAKEHAVDHAIGQARLLQSQLKLLRHDNQFAQSTAVFERAVALALEIEGPLSRAAIDLWLERARVLTDLRRPTEAKALLRRAADALESRGEAGRIQSAIEMARAWALLYERGDASWNDAMQVITHSRDVVAGHAAVPPIVQARLDFQRALIYLNWTDAEQAEKALAACVPVLEKAPLNLETRRGLVIAQARVAAYLGHPDRAEAFFRQALDLNRQRGFDHVMLAAADWADIAAALSMQGEFARAEATLDLAPTFEADAGDADFPHLAAILMPIARARVRLDAGDAQGALAVLPPFETLSPAERVQIRIEPLYGEALCAGGRSTQGWDLLVDSLRRSQQEDDFRYDPDVARYRAVAGLCALAVGRRDYAETVAALARETFDAVPRLGAYYQAPLLALESALHAH